jgi:hypothetical protein
MGPGTVVLQYPPFRDFFISYTQHFALVYTLYQNGTGQEVTPNSLGTAGALLLKNAFETPVRTFF